MLYEFYDWCCCAWFLNVLHSLYAWYWWLMFMPVYAILLPFLWHILYDLYMLSSLPVMICTVVFYDMSYMTCISTSCDMYRIHINFPFYDLMWFAFYDRHRHCLLWLILLPYMTRILYKLLTIHSVTCTTMWFLWVKKIGRSNSTTCYCDFYELIRFEIQIFPPHSCYMRFYGCIPLWLVSLPSMTCVSVFYDQCDFYGSRRFEVQISEEILCLCTYVSMTARICL